MSFPEDFLHFVWKFKLFDFKNLETELGDAFELLSVGIHNKHAGPDFEQAKIKIADTNWAGSVEIHIKSSDWDKHNHAVDAAYNNVILHVVYENDRAVFRQDGTALQTFVLKNRIPKDLEHRYRDLVENLNWIPCEKKITQLASFYIKNWFSRVLIERLEEKSIQVNHLVNEYKGSWDDAFYVMLARNFGFKTNALPFEMLARSLPQQLLAKHKNSSLQIEALIFGQAGFLNTDFTDVYPSKLKAEYQFLAAKYNLKPIDNYLWKFMRMRPQNFPTVRLAQFAALVVKSNHLFSKVLEMHRIKELHFLFENLPVSDYWETRFRFDKESAKTSRQIGNDSINNILLNTVSLFLFSYGKSIGKEYFISRAINLLESLPHETNHVTRGFSNMGITPEKADSSQAMLQLKKAYCDHKRCLSCGIGVKLINQV